MVEHTHNRPAYPNGAENTINTSIDRKKTSPKEFDEFMHSRILKQLKDVPKGEKGCICGSYFDVYFPDNKLVECSHCGVPLYVRSYIYEIIKERNWEVFCQVCMPPDILKGKYVQDLAAFLQYVGAN